MAYKKSTFFIFAVSFLFVSLAGLSYAELQAGVSPLVLDLGTLDRGASTVGSFFIVTSSQDEILVKLSSQPSSLDFFRKPDYAGIIDKISEEDSSGWAFFPSNPYVLKPQNESLKTAAGSISDWKRVNFVLNVPKNAEPCNHAFQVKPSPYIVEEYGNGVNIVAVTAITVKFLVSGECNINGRILDIMQNDNAQNVQLDVYFQNTGTATVSAYVPEIAVSLENGTKVDSRPSGHSDVKPGETAIFSAGFAPEKFLPGKNYVANATVSYGANSTSKQVTLAIHEPKPAPAQEQPRAEGGAGEYNYAFLVILIIILAIAYYVYRDDLKEQRA
ncbi:Uncharacterised protein [uncultured archaeon]|nr:Uncharacterised protein [uncultured archaeon]